jgi:hypothetical protein
MYIKKHLAFTNPLKKHLTSQAVLLLFLLIVVCSQSAYAMRCGTHLISAGRSNGISKDDVIRKCGAPYSQSGNYWIYMKGNSVYRLRFSETSTSGLIYLKREIDR